VTFYEAFIFPGNMFFLDATSISKFIGKANVCDNWAFFAMHQMDVELLRMKKVQSVTRKK
jgi:hypothetical protein